MPKEIINLRTAKIGDTFELRNGETATYIRFQRRYLHSSYPHLLQREFGQNTYSDDGLVVLNENNNAEDIIHSLTKKN